MKILQEAQAVAAGDITSEKKAPVEQNPCLGRARRQLPSSPALHALVTRAGARPADARGVLGTGQGGPEVRRGRDYGALGP